MWAAIRAPDWTILKSGFTPMAFTGTHSAQYKITVANHVGSKMLHMWMIIDPQSTGPSGTIYKLYASNYKDRVFDHWSDGSADRVRMLTINEATTITAYYRTG